MTAPPGNCWDQFDEAERQRRAALARHKQAFRQLDIAASATHDKGSIEAWESYCSTAKSLEASVTELERLVWNLRRRD
jgi:hypothetical protein